MQDKIRTSLVRGFSLIELMIVVSLIGILAAMAVPSYQQYTKRARFAEVVTATAVYKTAVMLALQEGWAMDEVSNGMHGIPEAWKSTKNTQSIKVEKGIITAFGTNALENANYVLQPNSDGSAWTVSGTCLRKGYCHG